MRGYHTYTYKDIWDAVLVEELPCKGEVGNRVDVFAVAVMKDETIVGHVPKKISSACFLYLRRGGLVVCRVSGSTCYSEDLVQGGLEIPCVLILRETPSVQQRPKSLSRLLSLLQQACLSRIQPICLQVRRESFLKPDSEKWVQLASIVLTRTDKGHILAGGKLNDLHIELAQGLLKQQFPVKSRLRSPLLQKRSIPRLRTGSG